MTEPKPDPPPYHPWRQMKPNKMFSEEIRYLVRSYVPDKSAKLPPCPACGKRSRGRWTMLCPFRVKEFDTFALTDLGEFPPLALVCSAHLIAPTDPIAAALV